MPFLAAVAFGVLTPAAALAVTPEPITGTVTDAGNLGIPGIVVTVENAGGTPTSTTATTNGSGVYTTPAIAPGSYVVEFNRGSANPNFTDQFYNNSPNLLGSTPVTVTDGDATTSQAIDDVLNGLGSVSGTVTDASTSSALRGIDVRLENAGGVILDETHTGPDGTYTFSHETAGTDFVSFNADQGADYVPQFYNNKPNLPADPVTVPTGSTTTNISAALGPASGHITGTVTAAGGSPVPGVDVEVLDSSGNPLGNLGSTFTASDGTYTVPDLVTGTYEVRFQAPSGANLAPEYYNQKTGIGSAASVSVTNHQTTPGIDAAMSPGGTITGTITKASGTPISGATVVVQGGGQCFFFSSFCSTTTSAADGTYTLQGLAPGNYYVEFDPPNGQNFVAQYFSGAATEAGATPVAVASGSTASGINAALQAGGQITGTVTNAANGSPVAGIEVDAAGQSGRPVGSATTDANGNYTIMGLTSGSYNIKFIGAPAFVTEYYNGAGTAATAARVAVTQGQTAGPVNQALIPAASGGRISGGVAGTNGQPISGITVTVYDTSGNQVTTTQTDLDGSYKSPAVLSGSYKVGFQAAGANLAFQFYRAVSTLDAATPVSVAGGSTTPGISATMGTGGTMTGTVTDASNHTALDSVEVDLVDAAGRVLDTASTNPDGTYLMSGIATGSYHVEFLPNGLSQPGGALYADQFFSNKLTLASSDVVSVTAGANTPNISAGLVSKANVALPTTVTPPTATPPPPAKHAGKPTVVGVKLAGIGKRKVTLKFKLTDGNNGAPKLKSFKVTLPKGLSFISKGLKKGVKVTGGGRFTEKLSKRALVVTLKKTASSVSLAITSKAISVTKALAKSAKRHKVKSLKVGLSVTDAKNHTSSITLKVKKPS